MHVTILKKMFLTGKAGPMKMFLSEEQKEWRSQPEVFRRGHMTPEQHTRGRDRARQRRAAVLQNQSILIFKGMSTVV